MFPQIPTDFVVPKIPTEIEIPIPPSQYAYADTQFEIIRDYILEFQESLDNEHDVGLMLTNFGSTMVMQVTEIGYEESVLMIFKGFVNGRESTLIQHVSQLNFLLTSVEKPIDVPKRKIGFTVIQDEE